MVFLLEWRKFEVESAADNAWALPSIDGKAFVVGLDIA